ncbi:ral guanine nucleotide dissociation stimulator-like isoform X2 [Ursus maritimus]|uniref:Ral guanine nucleotide dissociation stimulator-like isoform X2 n=1 Tax=Ursus maritimus TaxID=29073 RepID=A0A8M1F427_URSMA|nr:ral guanine nucleotide dissociation stimulator-like isoform X2 [Ursus maritimus]XP_040476860.1 ral guanine nucleotide dissociation stimulator-like isoform X2 [Ursus maritimus]
MLRLREGTMERFVQSLVPSFPDGSISTTSTIFCMYEMFTSATQVLGQQFNSTLSPFLGTWPDQNLQAIYQSLGRDRVEIKVAYVHGAMVLKWHAWDLTNHVPLLLMQRELLALTEAEVEVPAPGLLPAAEPGTGPPIELEATPALCQLSPAVSEPASPPSAVPELQPVLPSSACVPGAEQQSAGPPFLLESFTQATATEPTAAPEASCHRCVTPKNQLGEEKPDLLDFPPRLVAEQLTYMDAELFKKLLPHQCLGSVWSKRNKPGSEHLAPTVRATVAQFNGVAKCVITTCLGNPSMTARDRAMVVEHWIKVAKACQTLRNYSSLHAILSALQSVSIHRLENTWGKVSRKPLRIFQKLCSKDTAQGRNLLIKDTGCRAFPWHFPHRAGDVRYRHGGLSGGMSEVRLQLGHGSRCRRLVKQQSFLKAKLHEVCLSGPQPPPEYQVMTDIMLLQVAAENYTLEPEDPFWAWFQAMESLSEAERPPGVPIGGPFQ